MTTRRQALRQILALSLIYPLTACAMEKNMFGKKEIVLDAVVFNYINRPIFDVYLNHEMVGGSASLSNSPYGQFSTVTGVEIPFGQQTLTWRLGGPKGTPRNGETVSAKNTLTLTLEQIPKNARYISIHIYPDETVELTFTELPEQSHRGLGYAKGYQKK